jgi:hypothetical protein
MTYVELYNEVIRDLLSGESGNHNIRIRENLSGETVLENVKEILVVNAEEAVSAIAIGESTLNDIPGLTVLELETKLLFRESTRRSYQYERKQQSISCDPYVRMYLFTFLK